MQVLLEERVIGRNAGEASTPCETSCSVMRDERRVDMHQVHVALGNASEDAIQGAPTHPPVFGILRNRGRRDAENPRLVTFPFIRGRRLVITWHDQQGVDATRRKILAKSTYRR